MDESLLATKGIKPGEMRLGFVDDFDLRIGERATLVRRNGCRAHGVVMEIETGAADELYSDSSVADYLPETVTVELTDGRNVDAICYNLPVDKVTGTNRDYTEALLVVATNLGLPESYLDRIRQLLSR